MHVAALTRDNKVLTWGVNDHGALGRDTTWDGGMVNAEENDHADNESDSGLNPHESTPLAVSPESFPPETVFVQLACGDSTTFALTDTGDVYGWGTFRDGHGILGFSEVVKIQTIPIKMPVLKQIKSIACGANHALALNEKGQAYVWGSSEQGHLGHRIIERKILKYLTPTLFRQGNKIRLISSGQDHSFAVQEDGVVWTWGLNNYGQTGINEGAGEDNAVVPLPVRVPSLFIQNDYIVTITGGAHHSIAITANGLALVWGRLDGDRIGIDTGSLAPHNIIADDKGIPRILTTPTALPVATVGKLKLAAAGTDHTICVNTNGEAFSWGFNANYQCGHGHYDDIGVPTQITNSAIRHKSLIWAGAGGLFSMLAAASEEVEMEGTRGDAQDEGNRKNTQDIRNGGPTKNQGSGGNEEALIEANGLEGSDGEITQNGGVQQERNVEVNRPEEPVGEIAQNGGVEPDRNLEENSSEDIEHETVMGEDGQQAASS